MFILSLQSHVSSFKKTTLCLRDGKRGGNEKNEETKLWDCIEGVFLVQAPWGSIVHVSSVRHQVHEGHWISNNNKVCLKGSLAQYFLRGIQSGPFKR